MKFTVKIAGIAIEICHRYEYIKELCLDYLTDEAPSFSVSASERDIDEEMALTQNRFPRQVCESTCLHREITKGLVKYGIILMHSAVIAVDGEAYVFMAKSGVGKSTHIRLWKEVFGERAFILNGDKPMFSFIGERLTVHGSPWRGKEKWGENMSLPVKAICFVNRGEKNTIGRAASGEITSRLFHQVLLPKNAAEVALFMDMINRIVKNVPFYNLYCNMEKDAAFTAYKGMQKE